MAAAPSPKPATPKSTEPDPNADLKTYVVVADAITYRTGRAKDAVRRFGRGARLRLHSEEERVKDLVRSKSIAEHKPNDPPKRTTAMQLFKNWGAEDDPAQPPVQDIQPTVAVNDKPPVEPTGADETEE